MLIRKQFPALLALMLLPPAALAADIRGTWKASLDTSTGKQEYTYAFVVKDATLSGTAKSATGESDLVCGKVDGDTTVTFVGNFTYQGNKVAIAYTGKVICADQIHFSRDVSGMDQEELVAKCAN